MDAAFWAGRRVFLTGHTGFKGAWLTMWLQHFGAHVVGYSIDVPTEPSLFRDTDLARGMQSHMADVRDYETLLAALKASNASVVFHLAAQAIVSAGYAAPRDTVSTNVMGTANLLDAVRHCPSVKAVVVVTSDKCYAPVDGDVALSEVDILGGKDPYSASKSCAEILTASWRHSYFQEVNAPHIGSARAGNVIGGGDWSANRLLPDIARAFSAKRPFELRMPNAVRPWQHVLDALSGYLLLAEKMSGAGGVAYSRAWNFGPAAADHLTTRHIAERCAQLWGEGAGVMCSAKNFQTETHTLRLDATLAQQALGWHPRWAADEALQQTIAWYRLWHSNSSDAQTLLAFSRQQIDAFMARKVARVSVGAGDTPMKSSDNASLARLVGSQ